MVFRNSTNLTGRIWQRRATYNKLGNSGEFLDITASPLTFSLQEVNVSPENSKPFELDILTSISRSSFNVEKSDLISLRDLINEVLTLYEK